MNGEPPFEPVYPKMDKHIRSLVERIHDSPTQVVIVIAGAGSLAVHRLLSVPGASRTVLEVLIPYSSASLADLLGDGPTMAVSARTGAEMARRAYERAARLREGNAPVVGLSCTAAIVTDRPRRGAHRCHVEAWSSHGSQRYSLVLEKGLRDRCGEESAVSALVLNTLAEVSRTGAPIPLPLTGGEHVVRTGVRYKDPIGALIAKQIESAVVEPNGEVVASPRIEGAVLSGSFNPVHEGHMKLAEVASRLLDTPVVFELSTLNVDKQTLGEATLRTRVSQLNGKYPLVITRAPVFHKKAPLMPGCTFVIGWDTAIRVVDPRYYDGSESAMIGALQEIRSHSCRFLVAGRESGGLFRTIDSIPVPSGFTDMFTGIPESAFRQDLSSSDLRSRRAAEPGPPVSRHGIS